MSLADIEIKYGNEDYEETFDGPEVELNEDEIEEPIVPTEEFESNLRDAEDIDKATVAVESYLQILTQREKQGLALTEDVAKIIRVGLEAIDPNFFSNTVISVENVLEGELVDDDDVESGYGAKETNSIDPASKRTKSGLMEKFKKLMAAAFEALKRVFHGAMNLYHNLVTNVDKLLTHVDNVAKRSTGLEGGHKFKMRGLGRLSIDGKFVGDDPKQYEKLARQSGLILHDVGIGAFKGMTDIYKDFLEAISTEDGLRDVIDRVWIGHDEGEGKLNNAFSELMKRRVEFLRKISSSLKSEKDSSNVPNSIKRLPKMRSTNKDDIDGALMVPMKSETLLGNKAFYLSLPNEKLMRASAVTLNMGVFTEPKKESSLGAVKEDISTINARDAIGILANIKGLLSSIKEHRTEFTKVNKDINNIVRQGSATSDKLIRLYMGPSSFLLDEAKANSLFVIIQEYNKTLRQMTQSNWGFIGYLIATSKAAVAMINQMVEVEGVKEGETTAVSGTLALPAPK